MLSRGLYPCFWQTMAHRPSSCRAVAAPSPKQGELGSRHARVSLEGLTIAKGTNPEDRR
jgi:hypothetical protein